jgi:predicted transcriptional regulator
MPSIDWSKAKAKRTVRKHKGHERIPLSSVRKILHKTQVEVAVNAGVPQAEISRLESRVALGEDARLSSLDRYAQALGGKLEVAIVVDGRRFLVEA